MLKRRILPFFTVLIGFAAQAAVDCPPTLGRLVRLLAENRGGTEVALRENASGGHEVIKAFHSPAELQKELTQWRVLDSAYRTAGSPDLGLTWVLPKIHLAPVPGRPGGALSLPYFPGHTLHELLLDPSTSAELKAVLLDRYGAALYGLVQMVRASDIYENSSSHFLMPTEDLFRDGRTDPGQVLELKIDSPAGLEKILIKTDNIIVNPETLEFQLIDPY